MGHVQRIHVGDTSTNTGQSSRRRAECPSGRACDLIPGSPGAVAIRSRIAYEELSDQRGLSYESLPTTPPFPRPAPRLTRSVTSDRNGLFRNRRQSVARLAGWLVSSTCGVRADQAGSPPHEQ
eukprot:scaffold1553_cov132-Isochrysis_galbana.AAC.7